MADTYIAHGLHTLGRPPQGQSLVELATQLLRLRNGSTPSLREALAGHWDLDYDQMLANRGGRCGNERFATNAQALKALHEACLGLVGRCIEGSPSRKARSDRKGPKHWNIF